MTVEAVADGIGITNEERGALDKRLDELKRRLREGTLPFGPVMNSLQQIIEGKFTAGGLLEFVSTVSFESAPIFAAAEHFKVGAMVGDRKIGWIGDNFRRHFMDVTEIDVPARTGNAWRLAKSSRDPSIIDGLGGEKKAESFLAHSYQAMTRPETLTSGYANIAYKRSPVDGKFWAVDCGTSTSAGGTSRPIRSRARVAGVPVIACSVADPFCPLPLLLNPLYLCTRIDAGGSFLLIQLPVRLL